MSRAVAIWSCPAGDRQAAEASRKAARPCSLRSAPSFPSRALGRERTAWAQRIHAVLFHQGAPQLGEAWKVYGAEIGLSRAIFLLADRGRELVIDRW